MTPKMITAYVGGAIGVLLLVLVVGSFASWGWRWVAAPIEGAVGAREEIQSSEFRIAAYERFFNLCSAVQSHEAQIDAISEELQEAPEEDRSRIRSNLTGVRAQRMRLIREYNSEASRDYTTGQFRSANLPDRLDASEYPEESEGTRCTYGD